jgi:hypothetical protein
MLSGIAGAGVYCRYKVLSLTLGVIVDILGVIPVGFDKGYM